MHATHVKLNKLARDQMRPVGFVLSRRCEITRRIDNSVALGGSEEAVSPDKSMAPEV